MGKMKALYMDYMQKYEDLILKILEESIGFKANSSQEAIEELNKKQVYVGLYQVGEEKSHLFISYPNNEKPKIVYEIVRDIVKIQDGKNFKWELTVKSRRVQ